MLSKCLTQIPGGDVKVFLCTHVLAAISQFELFEVNSSLDGKVVVQTWERLPEHETVLEDILQALAKVTLAIWPIWYGGEVTFHSSASSRLEDALLNQFKLRELQATRQDVCLPWLKAAVSACQAGKLPVLPSFSRTVQVSQLAFAIAPLDLVIILAVCDHHPQDHRLLSLARTATWLAQSTQARVAVLLPGNLAEHPELDCILYGAIALPTLVQQTVTDSTDEESKHVIWPIQGKPHPFSPRQFDGRFWHKKRLKPMLRGYPP
jgi:hypothetical protein